MKKLVFQLGLLLIFFVSVSFTQDSDLVELAKKEKERRAKVKASKTFTNKDLEEWKAKQKAAGAITDEEETAATSDQEEATAGSAQPTGEQDLGSNEDYWKDKTKETNARVKEAQEKVDGAQTDINALNRLWYQGGNDDQRRQVEFERKKRIEDIESAKKELEDAKQAQENLEDEARQAGAPAGWVRSDEEEPAQEAPEEQQ